MPSLLWKTDLDGGPVLVAAGRAAGERDDVAASSGSRVFLFVPEDGDYRYSGDVNAGEEVTGLAAGRPGPEKPFFYAASTGERILLLGAPAGALEVLARADQEQGAGFSDVAAGDLDGDGRNEIAAASPGTQSVFVYNVEESEGRVTGINLLGIRAVPGAPRYVEIVPAEAGGRAAVAVAYENGTTSGVVLYFLEEEGFQAGPVLEGLPFRITALAAGNFLPGPGQNLAIGAAGGMVWILTAGQNIEVAMVTDTLGTAVSSLAAARGETSRLLAGTPEGNVFVFNYPVRKSPDYAFSPMESITGLAGAGNDRVAVGTSLGSVQVWTLAGSGGESRYIVMPGDTLWKIAGKHGVTVEQIISINENIKRRDWIMPGQIIRIPVR